LVRDRFGRGIDPVTVLVDVDDGDPAFVTFANEVNRLQGVRLLGNGPELPEGHAILDISPAGGDSSGATARRLVTEIRALREPLTKQGTRTAGHRVDYPASGAHPRLGVLVWVFQDGHLAWLLRFDRVGSIDLTTPLLLLVLTFGLSMDYEVFLLARVKEAWDATGDNGHAIA